MKYYVVSDIHSYYSYLRKALEDAGFFDETEPCMLIVCGDLLDRGLESKELIEFMVQLLEEGRLIYILGNHEELFVQCLHEIAWGDDVESHFYLNKTWDSLLQISEMNEMDAYKYPDELLRRVMQSVFYKKLLPACVDYFETSNYIFGAFSSFDLFPTISNILVAEELYTILP